MGLHPTPRWSAAPEAELGSADVSETPDWRVRPLAASAERAFPVQKKRDLIIAKESRDFFFAACGGGRREMIEKQLSCGVVSPLWRLTLPDSECMCVYC